MKKNLSLALITVLLFFISCKKNDMAPGNTHPTQDELVSASLQGRVLDENGLPVKDAAVKSGAAATVTDVNGMFRFTNIQLYRSYGFVQVKKAGYFDGSRTITVTAGAEHYVEIELLPKILKGSFAAGAGGAITVAPGCTVAFELNAVVNAVTNASYTGTVNVYAVYLDPGSSRFARQMPGDLRGQRTDSSESGMESFGMMQVELENTSGEKLQVAPGKKATLNMTIPTALQASSPASIPLWYFDMTKGKWIEEGAAVKTNNAYTGTVNHFTWWNTDAPGGIVTIKAKFVNPAGNPVALTEIRFSVPGISSRSGFTNQEGSIAATVPRNTALVMDVMNRCNAIVFSRNLGPYNSDVIDLGTITVNLPGVLTFTGLVVNCANTPVLSGFVNVKLEGINYRSAITNGNFSLSSFPRCINDPVSAEITAYDESTGKTGQQTMQVSSGTVNTGTITACNNVNDGFINMTIGGINYTLAGPLDPISSIRSNTLTTVTGNNQLPTGSANYVQATFNFTGNPAAGQYPASISVIKAGGLSYRQQGAINCTVTQYGAANEFVEGSFSGLVALQSDTSSTAPTKTIILNFKAKRP